MVKNLPSIIGLLVLFGLNHATVAQNSPPCLSNATDPDGDGYGWEDNSTCIIDTNTAGPKSFTNLEAGTLVNLVRAYWQPDDFDKDVVCTVHSFDGSRYQRLIVSNVGYLFTATATTLRIENIVEVSKGSTRAIYPWTVENGIYKGPGDFERTQWVEIINYNFPVTANQSAVRFWYLNETYSGMLRYKLKRFFYSYRFTANTKRLY